MAEKAGMASIDKQRINQIITEISKDSDYYKREEQRASQARLKADEMKKKLEMSMRNGGSLYQSAQKEMKMLQALIE